MPLIKNSSPIAALDGPAAGAGPVLAAAAVPCSIDSGSGMARNSGLEPPRSDLQNGATNAVVCTPQDLFFFFFLKKKIVRLK